MALSNFIEGTTLQWAWDATSLSLLQECPRKYEYSIILGWRKRDESVHLWFGGHFASALERYHKFRAQGNDHEFALDAVVAECLLDTWDRETEAPVDFEGTPKTRFSLIRSIVWYLDEYEHDPAETVILANGQPAVELSFKLELPHLTPSGDSYFYSGHLDRLVDFAGTRYVQDQKTSGAAISSYYFRQFNPDNQFTGYTFASKVMFDTKVSGVMIDAAQIAVGFTSFARGLSMRTEAQLNEWLAGLGDWFTLAERYAETRRYPMNPKSCGNYGGCPFRGVCSSDPAIRESVLRTDFHVKRWNPLEER